MASLLGSEFNLNIYSGPATQRLELSGIDLSSHCRKLNRYGHNWTSVIIIEEINRARSFTEKDPARARERVGQNGAG